MPRVLIADDCEACAAHPAGVCPDCWRIRCEWCGARSETVQAITVHIPSEPHKVGGFAGRPFTFTDMVCEPCRRDYGER